MLKIVRRWQPGDRDAVLALNAALQEHERALRPSRRPGAAMTQAYVAAIEAQLAAKGENGAVFVAEGIDGTVQGFATCFVYESDLEQDARQLCIEDLAVAESSRRRGVGRALIAAACRFAAERGVRRVEITAISPNTDAVAAYLALGFTPARVTLEYWLPQPVAIVP